MRLNFLKNNIILIGMPGAGKSTIGVVLAKKLGYEFIDSDIAIQNKHKKILQELINEHGIKGFEKIENDVNKSLNVQNSVIATGGSAIYGKEAMEHFNSIGTIIYLNLPYEEIEQRLGNLEERGVTIKKGQTLKDLYNERTPLYKKYANIVINCQGKTIREIVEEISATSNIQEN